MPRRRVLLAVSLVAALPAAVLAWLDVPVLTPLAYLFLAGGMALLAGWLVWRLLQRFLWKVGRRLAFSYFLIGVLPIPMVLLLLGVAAYILAGFFLGHLYRDAVGMLQGEIGRAAEERLTPRPGDRAQIRSPGLPLAFALYAGGRRTAGDPRAPESWPQWLVEAEEQIPLVTVGEDRVTLAVARSSGGRGVVAFYDDDLAAALSGASDVWVMIESPGERSGEGPVRVQILHREIPLQLERKEARSPAAQDFFAARAAGEGFADRPILWWGELSGPVFRLTDGAPIADFLPVGLNGTLRMLYRHLFATSAEIDAASWGTLFALAFLLFDIYLAAAVMAVLLIVGLSRAVNRLSSATTAVQRGDFSVRIPAARRDQVGALQRSFNQMAANLEQLVATAAQKELLEKELAIARDLQKSLLPQELPGGDGLEFATLFEPSAAIGGDYFDILRLDERRLAVVIADVSGHGLSTGLHMAMIKAALSVLIDTSRKPSQILERLDGIVRSQTEGHRFFVTATISLVDFAGGRLEVTNAGHPPTYLVRGGQVEEILLPSSPLGALGHRYGSRELALEPGDVVVWLSDGLLEATNGDGEPFGYRRVEEALAAGGAGETPDAHRVRDRLLAAVAAHAAGRPAADDQTLVVMRYRGA